MSEELSIGAFAHRVGLTPSALRFYDDCGVLRPHRVDDATGYRFYAPDQEDRARLLRDLRRAGLPLPDARVVLDGSGPDARRVLDAHLRRTEESARSAGAAVREILRTLPDADAPRAEVRVGGPELASAIRQVAPAAAAAGSDPAILHGLLLEAVDGELRLVGTDRYHLSVRVLPSGTTAVARTVVPAPDLRGLATWAARATEVTLELTPAGLTARDGVESRTLAALDGAYPDYAQVLDGLPPVRTRLIVDRQALRDLLESRHDAAYVDLAALGAIPVVHTGEPADACFAPALLSAAVSAGVGPDTLIELTGPATPAVVRSADQGTFTTLVMPVRRPGTAG